MQRSSVKQLSPLELAAWGGMLRAHASLVRQLDRELEAETGLPLTQYEVLLHLAAAPDQRLRMSELARTVLLSQSGVTRLVDRLEHCFRYRDFTGGWTEEELHPVEVLQRNFRFCALDDAAGFALLDRIGEDIVMVESDYPHADSTWPDTQDYLHQQLGFLPAATIEKLTWRNASELFRFPVPTEVASGRWHRAVSPTTGH